MARPAGAKQIARQPGGGNVEFTAAQRRVYGRGVQDRGEWLLRFAALDVRKSRRRILPKAQRLIVSWEALAFARYFDRVGFSAPSGTLSLPAWDAVLGAHVKLQLLLKGMREGRGEYVVVREWRAELGQRDGLIRGQVLAWEFPFREAFAVQAYETLTALGREGTRLRFCARETCRQAFLTKKTLKSHCSARCAQAELTRRYRESNPERFRELRRKAYAQAVRKVHPNATIQRQKSHVKP